MKTVTDITRDHVKPFEKAADVKDNLDRKFVIHGIETMGSEYGDIMFAIVSETEDGEQGKLFIRGSKVKERLSYIAGAKGFPCEGTFTKVGRGYELA